MASNPHHQADVGVRRHRSVTKQDSGEPPVAPEHHREQRQRQRSSERRKQGDHRRDHEGPKEATRELRRKGGHSELSQHHPVDQTDQVRGTDERGVGFSHRPLTRGRTDLAGDQQTRGRTTADSSQEPDNTKEEAKSRDITSEDCSILFYSKDQPYYELTNFAPYPIYYEGKEYPTAEHLFQAHKFLSVRPERAERVRTAENPRAAQAEATRMRKLQRSDWLDVNVDIMEKVLQAKFTQHPELRTKLLATRHAELVEGSTVDAFWGRGADGKGRNEMGKALMRVRKRLRRAEKSHSAVPACQPAREGQHTVRESNIRNPAPTKASVAFRRAVSDSARNDRATS